MSGIVKAAQIGSDSIYAALSGPILPWQTRLIKLLPGSLGDPLVAEMVVADLTPFTGLGINQEARYQQYEALSYSWGYPARTEEVEVNGKTIYVPKSMSEALQYLRLVAEPRWLWCDALCIDQENPAEKSNQVQVMMIIFSKASRVMAWLGMPPVGASTVNLSSPARDSKDQILETQDQVIHFLAQAPFFKRSWIRQEIFAAHEVVFQSGSLTYPFATFITTASNHESSDVQIRIEAFKRTYSAFNPGAMVMFTRQEPLLDSSDLKKPRDTMNWVLSTLIGNKGFDCTDDRDRVYALVGMGQNLAGGQSGALRIDYGQSLNEVYQDLTKHLINISRSLRCLELLRRRPPRGDIASWAIDWRQDTDAICLGIGETAVIEDEPEDGEMLAYLSWAGSDDLDRSRRWEDWNRRAKRIIPRPDFNNTLWMGVTDTQDLDHRDKLVLKAFKLGNLNSQPLQGSEIHAAYIGGTYLNATDEQLSQLIGSGSYVVRGFQFDGEKGPFDICAPCWAEDGDWLVLATGSLLPFIIRPTNNDNFLFVGACWFECLPLSPYLPYRTRVHDWITRLDERIESLKYGGSKEKERYTNEFTTSLRDRKVWPSSPNLQLMDIAERLALPDARREFVLV